MALDLRDDMRIASPCTAAWDAMEGDARARHCGECHKTVYDLSRMERSEALALIREKAGNLCVRLHRRYDGTVLTADCPVGRDRRRRSFRRWLVATAAACLGWVMLAFGCERRNVSMGLPAFHDTDCDPPSTNVSKPAATDTAPKPPSTANGPRP
jgi:hypothetical protein